MVMSMTPAQVQQMAELKKITGKLAAKVTVDYPKNTLTMELSSPDPQAAATASQILKLLSEQLAEQLSMFFSIRGELVDIKPPSAPR